MNRSTFRSLLSSAAASAIVALGPIASAGAQSIGEPSLTPEQVRSQYMAQGFQASEPITWWTDGSTTFTVEDPTELNSPSARILMVIVYPRAEVAAAERRDGAHLVPGYGPSILQGNVALMQTTRAELTRRYAAELNGNDPSYVRTTADPEPELVAEPSYLVGLDFLGTLQVGQANL
jgi:hypothetical protein